MEADKILDKICLYICINKLSEHNISLQDSPSQQRLQCFGMGRGSDGAVVDQGWALMVAGLGQGAEDIHLSCMF